MFSDMYLNALVLVQYVHIGVDVIVYSCDRVIFRNLYLENKRG